MCLTRKKWIFYIFFLDSFLLDLLFEYTLPFTNLDRITIIFVNYKMLIKKSDLAKTSKIQIGFTDLTKKKWVLVFFERFGWKCKLPSFGALIYSYGVVLFNINCSKKVWNITFALIFCTYFFIIFTWFLHFQRDSSFPYILHKKKRMKIDQVRAELQLAKHWGSKSKVAETHYPVN